MIKIFAEDADKQTLLDWQQTNSVTLDVDSASEATGLGLTTFPCIVEIAGSNVTKTYADSIDTIMALTEADLAEIIAKLN